jgi:hypothetical protein
MTAIKVLGIVFGLALMVWGFLRMTTGTADNGKGDFLFFTGLALVMGTTYTFG